MTEQAKGPKALPRFMRVGDVLQLPDPQWLLDEMIAAEGLAVIYGKSNTGKSFCCLDWALCVASGRPWMGRKTMKRPVLYVYAEGRTGLKRRLAAWQQAHSDVDLTGANAVFSVEAIPLCEVAAIDQALAELKALDVTPGLIVIDTFAASFSGDENASKDMTIAINGMKRLQQDTRTAVVVVHHTTKKGDTERGSGALRAAADTMLYLSAEGGVLELEIDKQRDGEVGVKLNFMLQTVATRHGTSCVLTPCDAIIVGRPSRDSLDAGEQKLLSLLPDEEIQWGDWAKAWEDATDESTKTAERKRKTLMGQNLVTKGEKYGTYRITETGKTRRDTDATASQSSGPTATDTDTPRRGVSVEGEVGA